MTVPRRVLCCSSSLFLPQRYHTRRLFCHCLFTSPSFGASGGLCFVIVAFPKNLGLYYGTIRVVFLSLFITCPRS